MKAVCSLQNIGRMQHLDKIAFFFKKKPFLCSGKTVFKILVF